MVELDWKFERENWEFAEGLVKRCRGALKNKDWGKVEFYYKMVLTEIKYLSANEGNFGFRYAYSILDTATDPKHNDNLTSALAEIHPYVALEYLKFNLSIFRGISERVSEQFEVI